MSTPRQGDPRRRIAEWADTREGAARVKRADDTNRRNMKWAEWLRYVMGGEKRARVEEVER